MRAIRSKVSFAFVGSLLAALALFSAGPGDWRQNAANAEEPPPPTPPTPPETDGGPVSGDDSVPVEGDDETDAETKNDGGDDGPGDVNEQTGEVTTRADATGDNPGGEGTPDPNGGSPDGAGTVNASYAPGNDGDDPGGKGWRRNNSGHALSTPTQPMRVLRFDRI